MGLVRRALAIGAVLSGMLALLAPAVAVAAFPGSNGRIAYAWHPEFESATEIFTILPDGSGRQQLTHNSLDDTDPSWSADGSRLAFSRPLGDQSGILTNQILTMNADGSEQTQVTHGRADHTSPAFSPSGGRIVYMRRVLPTAGVNHRRFSIWTIRTDGTRPRLLVNAHRHRFVLSPQYSPNGRRIVFTGKPEDKNRTGIWTVRRDGSRLRRLTDPDKANAADSLPDYSPDGRHIVFVRCELDSIHSCGDDLHQMRADGSGERPIPDTVDFCCPAHAPAGDRIAVAIWSGSYLDSLCSDIFTIAPTGSDRQQVTHDCTLSGEGGSAGQPSWQPLPHSP
jgi:Tol biopolymer transport system component